MNTQKCERCSHENPSEAKFCKKCGKEIIRENSSSKNKSKIFGQILGFAIVLAMIAGIVYCVVVLIPPGFRAVKNWAARISVSNTSHVEPNVQNMQKRKPEHRTAKAFNNRNDWSDPVDVSGGKVYEYYYTGSILVKPDSRAPIELPSLEDVKKGLKKTVDIGSPIEVRFMSCTNKEEEVVVKER